MFRNILAVAAGFVAWTAVFLGLATAIRAFAPEAHGADGSVSSFGVLLLYLALAVAASLLAGYVTARIAASHTDRMVLTTGIVLLAVGLPVQIASWSLAPSWYNGMFLLLLIPMTILGGRLSGHSH